MSSRYLRKRMTTAKNALGLTHNNAKRELNLASLARYLDKLQPLLPESYYQRLQDLNSAQEEEAVAVKLPNSELAFRHALHVPIVTVTNLTVQPGEPYFVLWLFISSYFPLVSACMAPVANLISVIALIQHWRVDLATKQTIPDDHVPFALNVLGFVFGIIGNISLLLNFSGKMKYLITQCCSIFSWFVAASLLLAAILITNADFVGTDIEYRRSEGFWLAVFTIIMYYLCAIVLVINFVGYKMKKYPAMFNLDTKQRLLMDYTIAFAVWQMVGTVVMVHLIDDLSYGASLYYCTVSMLTIGLGDIVPITPGAKVFALTFSFIGVIIMGLVVAMIRQVVLSSAGPSIFWHQIERSRVKLLDKIQAENIPITYEESFHRMRLLRGRARLRQLNASLILTILIFVTFWMVGALVFHVSERWDFFNCVYFCFLCLVTIGYGDFAPKSAFGRVFFVQWAIAAVPLMTILISNVGEELFNVADRFNFIVKKVFKLKTYRMSLNAKPAIEDEIEEAERSEDAEIESIAREGESVEIQPTALEGIIRNHHETSNHILANVDALKEIMFDSIDEPDKRYELEEWSSMFAKMSSESLRRPEEDPTFWLGEMSPLKLPIKEPNYLLMKMFFKIERELKALIEAQQHDIAMISGEIPLETMLASSLKEG